MSQVVNRKHIESLLKNDDLVKRWRGARKVAKLMVSEIGFHFPLDEMICRYFERNSFETEFNNIRRSIREKNIGYDEEIIHNLSIMIENSSIDKMSQLMIELTNL